MERKDRWGRRHVLGGAVAVATIPVITACSDDGTPAGGPSGAGSTPAPTGASSESAAPAEPTALVSTTDVPVGGGVVLPDQELVVTQPTEGKFKGFDATCTHQQCLVTIVTTTINCPCHGSKYALDDGSVTAGPAPAALTEVPLTVQGGQITRASG